MSVDGTWNVTIEHAHMNTPMGAQSGTLTLKSNGDVLEGTMAGAQGTVDIEDGKVDGDTATWGITAAQMGMKIEFAATVDGDKISGEAELGSFGKASFEGTRA